MEEGGRMLICTNYKSKKGIKLINQMRKLKKTKKLKTKLKGNGMELNRHRIWKPWEEKSHTLWSKTQNQKTRLKDPQRVVEKNFSGPTYNTYYLSPGSYDLQLSSYQKIVKIEWNGDNWTIQNTTWLTDER